MRGQRRPAARAGWVELRIGGAVRRSIGSRPGANARAAAAAARRACCRGGGPGGAVHAMRAAVPANRTSCRAIANSRSSGLRPSSSSPRRRLALASLPPNVLDRPPDASPRLRIVCPTKGPTMPASDLPVGDVEQAPMPTARWTRPRIRPTSRSVRASSSSDASASSSSSATGGPNRAAVPAPAGSDNDHLRARAPQPPSMHSPCHRDARWRRRASPPGSRRAIRVARGEAPRQAKIASLAGRSAAGGTPRRRRYFVTVRRATW